MCEVFGARLIEKIQPHPVRTCMDLRGQSAKARANREKALLTHIFNKAREWGYTDRANPCQGVKAFTEHGRDRYVSDAEFLAVHAQAHPTVQDAMALALLAGQRMCGRSAAPTCATACCSSSRTSRGPSARSSSPASWRPWSTGS
jgi:hypothetical protein